MAVGTSFWWLGIIVGALTFIVMYVSDSFPDPERERGEQNGKKDEAGYWKTKQ
jgi:hypothetical protein